MSFTLRQLPAASTLTEGLRRLRAAAAGARNVRIEIVIQQPAPPLAWLAAQPAGQRLYWADRSGLQIAGWGFADVRHRLPGGLDGRYFGGMAFDPEAQAAPDWEPLGRCRFFLPRLTLETDATCQKLVVHCRNDEADLRRVHGNMHAGTPIRIPGTIVRHSPDFLGWSAGIRDAIAAFDQGLMRKVVLARQTTVALHAPVDPFALLLRIRQPGGFVFGFEATRGHAFIGCSPERLFRREGRALSTEALAGTRRRGNTRPQDLLLAAELRADAKECIEHHHVVEAIEADLAPLCSTLSREERPRIRRLQRVQHLHTPFSGQLKTGVTDGDLLAAMHPTPAVCGRPTDRARQFIQQTEPFDRGWYAGPIGWLDDNGAEFAVAIRSALLVNGELRFCTGAGIVAASRIAAEWSELDAKSSGLTSLIRCFGNAMVHGEPLRFVGS